jgi:hypothetical protein
VVFGSKNWDTQTPMKIALTQPLALNKLTIEHKPELDA